MSWENILKIEPYERATAEEFAEEDMDDEPIEYKWERSIAQKKRMVMKAIELIQNLYNDARREKDAKLVELYKTTQDGLVEAFKRIKV